MIHDLSILDLVSTWLGLCLVGLGVYLIVVNPTVTAKESSPGAGLGGASFVVGILWLILFFTLLR